MPRLNEQSYQFLLSQQPEQLKSLWLGDGGIESIARKQQMDPDQFQALYRQAFGSDPGPSVMQTFFPAGGAGPGAGAGAGTRTQADILFYSKYGRWPEPGEATVTAGGGGAGDTFFDANGNEVPAGDPGAVYRRDSTGAFFSVTPGGGAAPPLGGGGAAGTTPPGMVNTGAGLPGAGTEEEMFAEFTPEMDWQRWLLEQPQYQKGSGFLRGTAERMRPEMERRWWLSQAANPQGFTLDQGGGPQPAQDWLSFITGGGARPTQQSARGSLANILGALEQPEGGNDPFTMQMQGQFGPEGTGGDEALRDLILEISGMNLPKFARGAFQRGAQQRFQNQFLRQPGGRVQDWARQWGLL